VTELIFFGSVASGNSS